ncbi:hypothetical protein D3C80_1596980 [compost metagenome]
MAVPDEGSYGLYGEQDDRTAANRGCGGSRARISVSFSADVQYADRLYGGRLYPQAQADTGCPGACKLQDQGAGCSAEIRL